MTKYLRFINIEAKMEPELVLDMQEFLKELTSAVKSILPSQRSQVLWYDSIIENGDLSWQNALNEKNDCFFRACDGIFTNYFWEDKRLDECKRNAKDRCQDVYVGVDVFGRCKEQPGELQSYIPVAKALRAGLSAAVFAPGWTFEHNKDSESYESYSEAQRNLWAASPTEGIGMILGKKPIACELPFYTSFNQGNGHAVRNSNL